MNLIRIGTRKSPLAMWQAYAVEQKLKKQGYLTKVIPISSHGDKNLIQPLYRMDIVGVFTKDLDIALLNNEVDIAVHSLKDVPTILPDSIEIAAFLERDYEQDILIRNPGSSKNIGNFNDLYVGCSSLRRRAFWKSQYPNVIFGDIRGNIQTRLNKLESENFDATIFSLAAIKRLNIPLSYEILDFIIPAPSQGVIAVTSLKTNTEIKEAVNKINHKKTQICVQIERSFLNELEGGCTAPVGAIAKIEGENVHFKAGIVSLEGNDKVLLNEVFPFVNGELQGKKLANKAKKMGADKIIEEIKIK